MRTSAVRFHIRDGYVMNLMVSKIFVEYCIAWASDFDCTDMLPYCFPFAIYSLSSLMCLRAVSKSLWALQTDLFISTEIHSKNNVLYSIASIVFKLD